MIDSPGTPYVRQSIPQRAADRAELVVQIPPSVAPGTGGLFFGTWTSEQEAQVVIALRVAAALMPAGVEISLRVSNGPTTLHRESVDIKTSDDDS